MATDLAAELLADAGFEIVATSRRVLGSTTVDFVVRDTSAGVTTWYVDVAGAFTKGNDRAGLRRSEAVWRLIGRAAVIRQRQLDRGDPPNPYLVLTADLPVPASDTARALAAVVGPDKPILDVLEMLSASGREQLHRYATLGPAGRA